MSDKPETQKTHRDPTIKPLREVHIDGLAVLQIIRHCNDSMPNLVNGCLLGVDINGILEVTYAFPCPLTKRTDEAANANAEEGGYSDNSDVSEYQKDMMVRLRDMNVDDNCVGWYQSTFLGTMCNEQIVDYQYSFQTSDAVSENTCVFIYDPVQATTDGGKLALKAYRVTDKFIAMKRNRQNRFINPSEILQELPIKIKNSGHTAAYVRCLRDDKKAIVSTPTEALSMANSGNYIDRNLELMNYHLDDLARKNLEFARYAREVSKVRTDHTRWVAARLAENAELRKDKLPEKSTNVEREHEKVMPECPESRTEPSLLISQLDKYSRQLNTHIEASLQKVAVTSKLY